jgi:hypothetical protein
MKAHGTSSDHAMPYDSTLADYGREERESSDPFVLEGRNVAARPSGAKTFRRASSAKAKAAKSLDYH